MLITLGKRSAARGNGERGDASLADLSASIPRVGLRPTQMNVRPLALPKDRRSFVISMGRSPMRGKELIPLLWRGARKNN
jgi:hypothetical protein